jgi:hypothetical protein
MTVRRTLDETVFVPLAEVMTVRGLGPRQARADIRKGMLPGAFDHRGTFILRRPEWDAYLRGDWTPAQLPVEPPAPRTFIRTVNTNAA